MKLAGFFLLLAGWGIVVASVAMLAAPGARAGFVLAGVAVEALGMGMVVRSHLTIGKERG